MERSIQLLDEEKDRDYKVIARRAVNKSRFLDGLKAAAKALGVTAEELIIAASAEEKQDAKAADGENDGH